TPFGSSATSGLRVATGDVTGDGVPDVVVANNGAGTARTYIRIIDGRTGQLLPNVLTPADYYYGTASLSVGDVTGDGIAGIAVGVDNGGPKVRVFRGGDFAVLTTISAGPSANSWGHTEVALADLNGDHIADLAVTSQYPSGTRVAGFDGKTLRSGVTP